MKLYPAIALFYFLQVGSGLFYKMGAVYKEHWWLGFVAGNMMGITSIYFLMVIYKHLNPNVGEAICRGGYFVLIQIAFILVFHSRLNLIQWGGVVLIVAGIAIVSTCASIR